jgi:tetratricopeptide (TPR) repeat protein
MAGSPSNPQPHRANYVPAVTPGLRKVLVVLFVLVALLVANSLYLVVITMVEEWSGKVYQNYFYQCMFLAHLVLGLLLVAPFLMFAGLHMRNAWRRTNRRAVWIGFALLGCSLLLLGSGIALTRAGPLELRSSAARRFFYWTHVVCPLVVVWLYCLHRLAGPRIKWRFGLSYLAMVGLTCVVLVLFHTSDPRKWNTLGSPEGIKYFEPSLARTSTGEFIPARTLANDKYCLDCHSDIHKGWSESAHRFSSFNNPAYLASVRETRQFSIEREGSVRRARWCAGCHDPVPFFSGQFDDPEFDDVNHVTAHEGITCTVCHAITHINSTRGNADYTIEEPLHYPFAYSENAALRWVNRQLVKAKPSFHKKTFLKPFHREAEFCSVCHKVHLPEELNDYKFLRGQNHYDSYLLSGVSGHGGRSFYYPAVAEHNCNRCHMPLTPSSDFAARLFPGTQQRSIHDHLFVGANTALPYLRNNDEVVKAHQRFMRDAMRVELFGLKPGGRIEDPLVAPLVPVVPALAPGKTYLLETVIRTLKLGHHFTQGTSDSNEVWLDVRVTSGDRVLGRSGALDETGLVDPYSHFVNVFMLDRDGNRIDRRNAQDIFVPLYDHQIPPGAAQTVHYRLQLPTALDEPVTVEVKLQHRKFDQTYMNIVASQMQPGDLSLRDHQDGREYRNLLPITTLASDSVVFPVHVGDDVPLNESRKVADWERWNDYGIGLLLTGRAQLRQAAEAFRQVEKLGRYDGPLNLARVHFQEGRLDEAVEAIRRATEFDDPAAPAWTLAWLSGLVNRQQGYLEKAERNFRSVLEDNTAEMRQRGFDFSLDYEVINLLGQTLFDRARQQRGDARAELRKALLHEAVDQFAKTLALDPENEQAHFNLQLLHGELGNAERQTFHRELHLKYKADDNARDRAVASARAKYPAADRAAEQLVIYDLQLETDR